MKPVFGFSGWRWGLRGLPSTLGRTAAPWTVVVKAPGAADRVSPRKYVYIIVLDQAAWELARSGSCRIWCCRCVTALCFFWSPDAWEAVLMLSLGVFGDDVKTSRENWKCQFTFVQRRSIQPGALAAVAKRICSSCLCHLCVFAGRIGLSCHFWFHSVCSSHIKEIYQRSLIVSLFAFLAACSNGGAQAEMPQREIIHVIWRARLQSHSD